MAAALAGVAAALALAGCSAEFNVGGSDPTVSGDEMATTIAQQYQERFPGLTLAEMRCEETPAEVGAPVRCTGVNSAGVELEFGGEITLVDENADRAEYRWEISRAVAPGSLFAERAAPIIEREASVTVASMECPERVEVRTGVSFRCEVTAQDGTSGPVTIVLTDDNGAFEVRGGSPD
jgi:hypothetical protein